MFKNIPHLFRHRVDVDPPPGATASRPRIRHATLQVAEYCGTLLSEKKTFEAFEVLVGKKSA